MDHQPFWIILIAAIFTNNILLSYFLGMCSFLAVRPPADTAKPGSWTLRSRTSCPRRRRS